MREEGFEPSQALSHWILSPARLTAPALPHFLTYYYNGTTEDHPTKTIRFEIHVKTHINGE